MMVDHLGLFFGNHLSNLGAADIHLIKNSPGIYVGPATRGKIINDGHLVPGFDITIHNMRCNETSSTCHQNFHVIFSNGLAGKISREAINTLPGVIKLLG